jgi:hypothetical protein
MLNGTKPIPNLPREGIVALASAPSSVERHIGIAGHARETRGKDSRVAR